MLTKRRPARAARRLNDAVPLGHAVIERFRRDSIVAQLAAKASPRLDRALRRRRWWTRLAADGALVGSADGPASALSERLGLDSSPRCSPRLLFQWRAPTLPPRRVSPLQAAEARRPPRSRLPRSRHDPGRDRWRRPWAPRRDPAAASNHWAPRGLQRERPTRSRWRIGGIVSLGVAPAPPRSRTDRRNLPVLESPPAVVERARRART